MTPRNPRTSHHHGGAQGMTQRSLKTSLPLGEGQGMTLRSPKTPLHLDVGHGMIQRTAKTSLHLGARHVRIQRIPRTSPHHVDGSARIRHSWTICHPQEGKTWDKAWGMGIFHHQGRVRNLHQMICLHLVRGETFLLLGRVERKELQKRQGEPG